MADLIRDVLGSPPPSPGQQVQQVQQMHLPVGSPLAAAAATHPWRVAPLARRPRGRPPGPNSIRNRPVAAAPFMPMGLGAQAPVFPPPPPVYPPPPGFGAVARGPPSATATTAQPGPATATAQPGQQGFECVVCRVSSDSLGSIPCGHLLCTHCVEGQVGLCPHSQCSATFTMDQYRRFRRN
ncbi:ran-binding protein 9-like [Thrips palmi]|uniref:Ran-binding protein 9-like n=1 Tax=Thrips palmi TaxID=161013 RepID=A0A6P9A7V7_THRPL|nr:ran-binding protein 9-like [Thrips palmi]